MRKFDANEVSNAHDFLSEEEIQARSLAIFRLYERSNDQLEKLINLAGLKLGINSAYSRLIASRLPSEPRDKVLKLIDTSCYSLADSQLRKSEPCPSATSPELLSALTVVMDLVIEAGRKRDMGGRSC